MPGRLVHNGKQRQINLVKRAGEVLFESMRKILGCHHGPFFMLSAALVEHQRNKRASDQIKRQHARYQPHNKAGRG